MVDGGMEEILGIWFHESFHQCYLLLFCGGEMWKSVLIIELSELSY